MEEKLKLMVESTTPMEKMNELYLALRLLDKIITRDIVKEDLGIADIIKKYDITIDEFNQIRDVLSANGISTFGKTYNF
jgi:hypothetical protein